MFKKIIKAALKIAAVSTGISFLTGSYVKGMFVKKFFTYTALLGLNAITAKGTNNTSGKNLGLKAATTNPVAPRNVVYGKTRVGGTIVHRAVSGTNNNKLHNVIAIAAHEINAIKKLYIDGGKGVVELDFSSDFATATENGATVYRVTNSAFTNTDNDASYTGGSLIKLVVEKGEQTTSNGYAVAQMAEWTTDHKLQGIAYVYINCIFDTEKFASYPSFSFEVEGKKVYDPVTTTTAYSTNPSLIIRDYLMDATYGFGATSDEINDAATGAGFVKARSDCNDDVTITSGTEDRYTLNGQFDMSEEPQQVLQHMLSACAGQLIYNNGKFSLFVGKERTASGTITDDKLLAPIQITTKASGQDLANGVKATYVRPTDRYIAAEITPYKDSTYLSADTPSGEQSANYENFIDVTFPYTQSTFTAQRLARIALDYQRQDQTLQVIVPIEFMTHQVGDIVNFTNTRLGYDGKDFEIIAMDFEFMADDYLALRLNLKEYSATVFNNISYVADPTLPSPPSAGDNTVATPTGLTLTESSKNTTAKEIYVRAVWTNANDDKIDWTEVAYKKSTDTEFDAAIVGYPRRSFSFRAESATTYNIKVRHGSNNGVHGDYTGVVNITTSADVGTFTTGSIAGITVESDKLYEGTGTFNNSNTGFYLDNTGQFSLKDKLSFNGTTLNISGNLTVENTISANKIVVDGINLDNLISASTQAGSIYLTEFTGIKIATAGGTSGYPPLLRLQDDQGTNTFTDITQSTQLNIRARNDTAKGKISFQGVDSGGTPVNYGGFDASGNFEIGLTDVIDASRNVVNVLAGTFGSTVNVLATGNSNNANGLIIGNTSTDIWKNITLRRYVTESQANSLGDGTFIYTTNPSSATVFPFTKYGATVIQCRDSNNSGFGIRIGNGSGRSTAFSIDSTLNATFAANIAVTGNATISGDLTVSGTTTTINTTNLDVADKNITLNFGSGDTSSNANGAGITIQDAVDASTNATLLWDSTNDKFDFSHSIQVPDNANVKVGSAGDLFMVHNGSNSFIQNKVGDFYIENASDDKDIFFRSDDGSGGLATYMTIDGSHSRMTIAKNTLLFDNVELRIGDNSGAGDLKIYHDGSNSYISEVGTGHLHIQGRDAIIIEDGTSGENYIYMQRDDKVELYFDGAAKLATTSSGIDVTGSISSGNITTSGSSPTYTLQDTDGTNQLSTLAQNGGSFILTARNNTSNGNIIFKGNNGSSVSEYGRFNSSGNFSSEGNVTVGSALKMGSTTVIDSSRNLIPNEIFLPQKITHFGDNDTHIQFPSDDTFTITTAGTERMRVDSGGKLLVGKTTADATNTVGHELKANGIAVHTSDGTGTLFLNRKTSDGTIIELRKDNSAVGVIGTQNWGIGTASPTQELHIQTTNSQVEIVLGSSSQTSSIFNNANAAFGILDGSSERLRVDSSGRLGIGTTSPSQTLDVAGNIQATGSRLISAAFDSNHYMRLEGNSSGGVLKGADGGVITTLVRSYGDSYFNSGGGNFGIGLTSPSKTVHVKNSSNNDSNVLLVEAAGATTYGVYLKSAFSGQMGRVGALSQADGDLDGASIAFETFGRDIAFRTDEGSNNSEKARLLADGKFGIGLTAPTSRLTVKSSSTSSQDSAITVQGNANTNAIFKVGEKSADGGRLHMFDGGVEKIAFYTDGTANHISAGFLGLGTSSPDHKLHVDGNIKLTGSLISDNTTIIDSSRNLTSIGTITSTGRHFIQSGNLQMNNGNNSHRYYYVSTGSGGGDFLLGQIEFNDGVDGAIEGTVCFAYDYGTTSESPKIHFSFAQRNGTARGSWWYEHDDDAAGSNNVKVVLIDDGSGGMFVWLRVGDFAKLSLNVITRQGGNWTGSGQLSSGTITTGTTLFDTSNDPTSEHHIGKLFAHGDSEIEGQLTIGSGSNLVNAGNMTIDVAGDITLDADGRQIFLKDGGTSVGTISLTDQNLKFISDANDKDMIFAGTDGGSEITALQLDMSAGGDAFFAGNISINDNKSIGIGTANDMLIKHDGSNTIFKEQGDGNVIFEVTDATIQFKKGTTETIAEFIPDSGVALYHDNTLQLATTSDGASTSGFHNVGSGYRVGGTQIIDSSRNLTNIGTYSGSGNISVTSASSPKITLTDTTNSCNLLMYAQDSNSHIGTYSNHLLAFDTNSTTRMVIEAGGQVGIGTSSPSEKLHINGSSSEVALRIDTTNADPKIRLTTLGQQDWSIGVDYSDSGKLKINESGNVGTLTALTIDPSRVVGIGNSSPASFWSQANSLVLDASGNTGMTIKSTSSGNGRIVFTDQSSSNPGFTDGGQIHYGHSADDMRFRTAGADRVTINNTGVGIGDTSPLAKLEVAGSIKATNRSTGHTGEAGVTLSYNTSSNIALLETWQSKPLVIDTFNYQQFNIGNTLAMFIDGTNRNVGINTNSPTEKLHVVGNILTSGGVKVGDSSADALHFHGILKQGSGSGTTVMDSSRNLTNIGSISCGAITSSGTEFILGSSSVKSRIRTINSSGFTETAFDNFSSGAYQERMRISSSGSVGIAKTNPSSSYKLDVNGKIRSQQEILINTGSLFINEEGEGIHILSANGTEYKLTVSDAGALVITEV